MLSSRRRPLWPHLEVVASGPGRVAFSRRSLTAPAAVRRVGKTSDTRVAGTLAATRGSHDRTSTLVEQWLLGQATNIQIAMVWWGRAETGRNARRAVDVDLDGWSAR